MRRSTLFLTSTSVLVVSTTVLAIIASACGGSDQPATQPSATAYNQQYPPQGQYPQQYPPQQQPYPQQPPPQTQPTMQPGPPQGGQMATPGPLALPCQNDGACGTHKCNTQFQKCAFPCQTAVDCGTGNNCMMGICAPGMPQQ
jgi:hypothetical protein